MKRFLTWLLRIMASAAVIALCVVNREPVTFSFYPLPYEIVLPKFLFALMLFALGMLCGALMNSLRVIDARKHQKQQARRAAALEDELAILRAEARHTKPPPAPAVAALTALPSIRP